MLSMPVKACLIHTTSTTSPFHYVGLITVTRLLKQKSQKWSTKREPEE